MDKDEKKEMYLKGHLEESEELCDDGTQALVIVTDDGDEFPEQLALAHGILAPYLPVRFLQLLGRRLEHVADTSLVYLTIQFLEINHCR